MTLAISFIVAVLALVLALVSPFALLAVLAFVGFWGLTYLLVGCLRGEL